MSLASHVRKDVGRTLRDVRGILIALALPAVILLTYSALDLATFNAFGRDPDAFILAVSTAFPSLLASSTALVEERRMGTFARLGRSPASFLQVVAAKSSAGFVIVVLQAAVLVALAPFLIGHGSEITRVLPALFGLLVLSGVAAHALGILIGSVVSTEGQAMQLTAMALLMMLVLSGFLQPLADLGMLGSFAEALPMALSYASLKSLFAGRPYGEQVIFFLVDGVVFILAASAIARIRRPS